MAFVIIFVAQLSYLVVAGAALALGGWILSHPARSGAGFAAAGALALTACWSLAVLGLSAGSAAGSALLSLSQLAWLWFLYRLFARDGRDRSVAAIRPVVLALAFVELMQLVLLIMHYQQGGTSPALPAIIRFETIFRLLFCIGALVLVHNLYAGASKGSREGLRWPTAALGVLWLYDLNLSTVAYLTGEQPGTLIVLRSVALLAVLAMLAIGVMRRDAQLRFGPSRSFTFSLFSLLLIGGYLAAMVLVAQGLAYAGGEVARMVQVACVALAAAVALLALPSRRVRGWLRVTVSKHLFQHRYDYRSEWLRFTETMGRASLDARPLGQRVIQAVADITESASGALLTPQDDGELALDTRWQWGALEVPARALASAGVHFFEQTRFVLDLDDLRAGRSEAVPAAAAPAWLLDEPSAWAMVPLIHYDRLVGIVVLSRPALARRLDWEDFDLLGVVGRQLASYLAEQASQDALGEAMRFDEFNRRIAFVMHDIKNLASQLSLLARNAEKHAEKPEFRADMLLTLRNSTDKLQALLARLGRYGAQGQHSGQSVVLQDLLVGIAARYASRHEVVVIERPPCTVTADRESLEQALVHLVHNAVEASEKGSPVLLDPVQDGDGAALEIIDTGSGMSAEFIRTRLFKPFHSSKPGGFGIGAFEARELIRATGGRLEVESREDHGTRFRIRLPLAPDPPAPDPVEFRSIEVA
jgi:putative PEP-CTERM system histidine kinase